MDNKIYNILYKMDNKTYIIHVLKAMLPTSGQPEKSETQT